MNSSIAPITRLTNIRVFTALVSFTLSIFAYYTDDLINADGILYLELSQAYINGGLSATSQLFNWPFFSILVAYIHQISSCSLETSAVMLNTLLFVLLTDTLVLISNKLLPNERQLIIAVLVILCFGTLNEYRHYIIRDIGFWAFGSLTLYLFILCQQTATIRNTALWQISVVIATLFRAEGIVLLVVLPFYLYINGTSTPLRQTLIQHLKLTYLFLLTLIITSFFVIDLSNPSTAFGKMSYLTYYINIDSFVATFNDKSLILGTQVLNQFSEKYGGFILASGLISLFLYKFIKALSIGYLAIYFMTWWQKKPFQPVIYQRVIIYFTAINILVLLTFLFQRYFLSTRHIMLALLGLLLLILPSLTDFIERAWLNKKRALIAIIGTILFVGLIDSMTSSRSKSYIKDTAIWASENLPENSHVLTDNKFISYYFNAHHPAAELTKKETITTYQQYDYLIIVEKRKHKELKALLKTMAIKPTFNLESKRGDKATVYSIQHSK